MAMKYRKLMSVLIVIVMLASASAVAYTACTYTEPRQTVFTGETIAVNSYRNPVFDITIYDLNEAGYKEGDLFDIECGGKTIHKALLSHLFLGTFIFDTYLNIEANGYLAGGMMWINYLPNDLGLDVKLTYAGHYDEYSKLDKFLTPFSTERSAYKDDATFANFYEVTGGNIKSGTLYRSFAPFNAKADRSNYVNQLAEQYGIQYGVALSYSEAMIQKIVDSGKITGYCLDLFTDGDYACRDITYHYFIMKDDLAYLLTQMAENDGPYLIHCNVGRDRTGFFGTLLQALCGADADTMKASAAQAYVNLYGVVPGSAEYDLIVKSTYCRNMYFIDNYEELSSSIPEQLPFDWSKRDVSKVDTQKAANDFCTKYLGLSQTTVDQLISNLCS